MNVKRLSGWLLVAAIASTLAGCIASADPSPEPTQKQGQELLPVGGGGGGGDGTGGNTCFGGADPNDPSTWYCLPASQCPLHCAPGFHAYCYNGTDYAWICTNASPGGCTHGCAPL
jgi:hypothetical protein